MPPADAPPEQVLERMATGLWSRDDASRHGVSNSGNGLHLQEPSGNGGFLAGEEIWVAIEGLPRWSRPELEQTARRDGDAAAVRQAYRAHGDDLLKHVQGPFSLAVIDHAGRRALLAVDRSAVQALHYATSPHSSLVFGTTAEAVRRHPAIGSTISAQSIYNYLYFYVSPGPGTIYREQHKLLPAQYLVFEAGNVRTGFYWFPPYQADAHGTARLDLLADELGAHLDRAVARSVAGRGASEVGAFLSGGLDSSALAGVLAGILRSPAKTFTIGFSQDEFDESHYARVAAEHFGTEHHEHFVTRGDILDAIPKIAEIFDEPFANSSVIAAYYCALLAKDHDVGLMLAGDGGDEIFAGNTRYVLQYKFEFYSRLPSGLRRGLIEPLVYGLPGGGRAGLIRRARSYIRRATTPMPRRMETYNFYESTELSEVFLPEAAAEVDPGQPVDMLQEVYDRTPSEHILHRMLYLDLKKALADSDLPKVNVACRLAGVDVRYPYLDEDLVNFVARIPPHLLIKGLRIRYFFKHAMRNFLPSEVLRKRKHGFGLPFETWFREDPALRQMTFDNLAAFKRRGFLRPEFIDRIIERPDDPFADYYDQAAYDICMLELWLRAHT
jgi:asparagine synthase (glutamine-hydrolysing)